MKFILIIAILLSLIYIQYYFRYKQDYQILQVYLNNFKLQHLYEKYPIVIYDQVYDVDEILKTILAYSFVFKNKFEIQTEKLYKNVSKFLLIYSNDSQFSIKIFNPKYKLKDNYENSNAQYITIKLKEKQVLILPALWNYYTQNMSVQAIALDDFVSKLIYSFV